MTQNDYFKPTYICGIYLEPKQETEGWGNMACSCISFGDTYEEVIHNYMDNAKKLYPFFDLHFWKYKSRWVCEDGRIVVAYRLFDSFIQNEHEPYRIGKELKPETN